MPGSPDDAGDIPLWAEPCTELGCPIGPAVQAWDGVWLPEEPQDQGLRVTVLLPEPANPAWSQPLTPARPVSGWTTETSTRSQVGRALPSQCSSWPVSTALCQLPSCPVTCGMCAVTCVCPGMFMCIYPCPQAHACVCTGMFQTAVWALVHVGLNTCVHTQGCAAAGPSCGH